MLKNNFISSITGTVCSEPVVVNAPDKMYSFEVKVIRKSGVVDLVNVVTQTLDENIRCGDSVRVSGFLYTYKASKDKYPKLVVCLYGVGVVKTEYATNKNVIIFSGTVVKEPQRRDTPLGTRICELLVAVNNDVNGITASYVPCIVWNENADKAKNITVGTSICGVGRLQSREYVKLVNGEQVIYTTRELSINSFETEVFENGV